LQAQGRLKDLTWWTIWGGDVAVAEKIALITGVTGQDGALLSRALLDKGYVV
jgi:hypothetical protein